MIDVEGALEGRVDLYEMTQEQLFKDEEKPRIEWVGVVTSLILLILYPLSEGVPLTFMVALLPVLLLHESGHLLGMLIFGYRNPRIYLLPLFGAMTTGKKVDAPAWQKMVVTLLGPAPGIVLGTALLFAHLHGHRLPPVVWTVAVVLLLINGFNLLPPIPLDGGRLLQTTVFSRHALLEILFVAAAPLLLAAIGIALGEMLFFVFAVLSGVSVPASVRMIRIASWLRKEHGESWPGRLAELDEQRMQLLFAGAVKISFRENPSSGRYAAWMEDLHQRITLARTSIGLMVVGIMLYGALCAAVGYGGYLIYTAKQAGALYFLK